MSRLEPRTSCNPIPSLYQLNMPQGLDSLPSIDADVLKTLFSKWVLVDLSILSRYKASSLNGFTMVFKKFYLDFMKKGGDCRIP